MNMLNNLEKEYWEILKDEYLLKVIQPSFPFIKAMGGLSFVTSDNEIPEITFHLPGEHGLLKNNEYLLPGSKCFIHYTSLESLTQIINNKYFRLNSLAFQDDPQEATFALNDKEVNHLKHFAYCLSFCEYDPVQTPDNFDAWRLYGRNGDGVGIVFTFNSDVDLWVDNYLGKIQYGTHLPNNFEQEKSTRKFKRFKKNHLKFIEDHKNEFTYRTNRFNPASIIPDWLIRFLAFHKSGLYKIENEIRFLRCLSTQPSDFTLNNRSEKTHFARLLIDQQNINDQELKQYSYGDEPSVKLEKIIIGYRKANKFEELKEALKEGLAENGIYSTQIEISPFHKAFE